VDTPSGPESEDSDALDPREAGRLRRRDHDTTAKHRALLRPGMGKVFKQIGDAQRKAATQPSSGRGRASRRGAAGR
jgi:hypothetical protein